MQEFEVIFKGGKKHQTEKSQNKQTNFYNGDHDQHWVQKVHAKSQVFT